ncbi:single-stranded-DNA-specific exonuclease RecJ [Actinobacillus equuli]|nr:single-stranded-DNA-specific exonuclease RecJ [Actinobacillus equuli]
MVEQSNGGLFDAIWFNADLRYFPDLSIKQVKLIYKLDINEFRGNKSLQLRVETLII